MRKIFIVMLLVIMQVPAHANAGRYNPFENWVSLTQHMRSQGLEPTKVDWHYVEQLCAPILGHGQEIYNRCKFEKAEVSLLHAADRQECRVVARSDYPKHLSKRQRRLASYHSYRSDGLFRHTDYRVRGIDKQALRNHRHAAVIGCMKDLGWASAGDWRLGAR